MTEEQRRFNAAVDHLFLATYGLTLTDAGFKRDYTNQFLADGWDVEQVVEWIGEKYDLIPKTEWSQTREVQP